MRSLFQLLVLIAIGPTREDTLSRFVAPMTSHPDLSVSLLIAQEVRVTLTSCYPDVTSVSLMPELVSIILVNLTKKSLLQFSATSRQHRLLLSEPTRKLLEMGVGVLVPTDPRYTGTAPTPLDLLRFVQARCPIPTAFGCLVPLSTMPAPCHTLIKTLYSIYGDRLIHTIRDWPATARGIYFVPHPYSDIGDAQWRVLMKATKILSNVALSYDDSDSLLRLTELNNGLRGEDTYYNSDFMDVYLQDRAITFGAVKCFWLIMSESSEIIPEVLDNPNFFLIVEGTKKIVATELTSGIESNKLYLRRTCMMTPVRDLYHAYSNHPSALELWDIVNGKV